MKEAWVVVVPQASFLKTPEVILPVFSRMTPEQGIWLVKTLKTIEPLCFWGFSFHLPCSKVTIRMN